MHPLIKKNRKGENKSWDVKKRGEMPISKSWVCGSHHKKGDSLSADVDIKHKERDLESNLMWGYSFNNKNILNVDTRKRKKLIIKEEL